MHAVRRNATADVWGKAIMIIERDLDPHLVAELRTAKADANFALLL